jgi:hypothetical protein
MFSYFNRISEFQLFQILQMNIILGIVLLNLKFKSNYCLNN